MSVSTVFLHYVTLVSARMLGSVRRWLGSGWRRVAIGLVAVAAIGWAASGVLEHLAHPERDWDDTFNLLALIDWVRVDAPAILVFYVLATALVWAWRSRSRVVVSEFEDFTGDQSKSVTRGLSTLLVVQLGRLGDLYAAVDYQRA